MGRDWTNLKFELENRSSRVQRATAQPPTQEEVLYDLIRDEWGQENIGLHENVDLMFGRQTRESLRERLEQVVEELNFIERVAVVYVSDSAHAGSGDVYSVKDRELVLDEEFEGYEGAWGEDVAGEISEKYHIHVSPEWLW